MFKHNGMQKIQKNHKLKPPYQSDVQGKGNLGANKKYLGSQNLHGFMEPQFTLAQINMF